MATWAIGDIQGCGRSFFALLDKIAFSASRDELWLAGDLVNRGPDNLSVLRYVYQLGSSAKIVLGNHDLHLLAVSFGVRKANKKDTIRDLLEASDRDVLLTWLRAQPLLHRNDRYCMTHAGIPPFWSVEKAVVLSHEVAQVLSDKQSSALFFNNMYGNTPRCWDDRLESWDRLRVITNYFTRMRFLDAAGQLDFKAREGLDSAAPGYAPWFSYPSTAHHTHELLFGHWAALEAFTGIDGIHALDSGCVWGGQLTAMNLESQERVSVKNLE